MQGSINAVYDLHSREFAVERVDVVDPRNWRLSRPIGKGRSGSTVLPPVSYNIIWPGGARR